MVGIPGSGKTHFAKQFSETFNAPLIAADVVAAHARDEESAGELIRSFVGELLKTKQSIVVDAGGTSRKDRVEFNRFLRENGYEPLLVWVQVDSNTAKQRALKHRKMPHEEFESALSKFSAPHQTEKPLVISGKHTYASQAKTVLKRLSEPRAHLSASSTYPQPPISQLTRRPGSIRVD